MALILYVKEVKSQVCVSDVSDYTTIYVEAHINPQCKKTARFTPHSRPPRPYPNSRV